MQVGILQQMDVTPQVAVLQKQVRVLALEVAKRYPRHCILWLHSC